MRFKIKSEATGVASPRSRSEKGKAFTKLKPGEAHQREFTKMIKKLFTEIDAQLEVEPKGVRITPETITNMINKKDKKKLN
jgi:tellurite resistance protein|tara:strand:- start:938 stop:1180 length:243 start_codon:yes stop_codon:yes gene_type:complete